MKHRAQAQNLVEEGGVRVNRQRVVKCSHVVKCDDVLTITAHGHVRVVKVMGAAERRGPPAFAQTLYCELGDTHGSAAQKQDASSNILC